MGGFFSAGCVHLFGLGPFLALGSENLVWAYLHYAALPFYLFPSLSFPLFGTRVEMGKSHIKVTLLPELKIGAC